MIALRLAPAMCTPYAEILRLPWDEAMLLLLALDRRGRP